MPDGLRKFVEEWRDKGVDVTDEDADDVYRHCLRKMEVAKIKDPDEYIFLLYPDELKNYLFRLCINAKTELMMIRKEAGENVFSMQADTVSPTLPNAPEPVPVMRCAECGEGIYAGDDYYDIGDGLGICKECIDEKSTSELIELFGECFSVAS